MKPRYLLDEHVNRAIQRQLRRLDVRLEVLAIGDPGAPSAGTSDPDLLVWLEKEGHILVTENRSTMPVHLAARYAAGGHIPGVFWIRPRAGLGAIIEEINVIKLGLLEAAERAPTPAFSADQTAWEPPPLNLMTLSKNSLIWYASEANEYQDRTLFIPL